MRIRFLALAVLSTLLLVAGPASADFSFQFTDQNGNTVPSNAFTVAQGSSVNVNLYLTQSNGETRLSSPGMISAGVALSYNKSIANTTAVTGNSSFDQQSPSGVGTSKAAINESIVSNPAVTAPTTGANANRIFLGQFTFQGVTPGTTSLQTSTPHAGSMPPIADNVLNDSPTFTSIDSLIANASATITVTAVPEPGSMILCTIAASACAFAAWRRRHPAKPA